MDPQQANNSTLQKKQQQKEQKEQQNNERNYDPQQNRQLEQNSHDEQQNPLQQKKEEQHLKNSMVSKKTMQKEDLWKAYDFLFPGGKLAKLIKINNIYKNNLPIKEMLEKFKYTKQLPVINLIGAIEKGRGKFYAGIARAAFNTDAVIVDNGLASGIQKFTLRRGVKLVGIAPQGQIKFPKINPSQVDPMELANGHTHLFLVNNPEKDLRWGGEIAFKIDLCKKIAEPRKQNGPPPCRIVSILMADADFDVIEEVSLCVENDIPIIVVPGSPICQSLSNQNGPSGQLRQLVDKGHFFYCNSTNSQDIAQLTHLLLSIKPW